MRCSWIGSTWEHAWLLWPRRLPPVHAAWADAVLSACCATPRPGSMVVVVLHARETAHLHTQHGNKHTRMVRASIPGLAASTASMCKPGLVAFEACVCQRRQGLLMGYTGLSNTGQVCVCRAGAGTHMAPPLLPSRSCLLMLHAAPLPCRPCHASHIGLQCTVLYPSLPWSRCRYGLVGRNGSGKSTLLRSIASGAFPGFPKVGLIHTFLCT